LLEGPVPLHTPKDLQQHAAAPDPGYGTGRPGWRRRMQLNNVNTGQHFETLDLAMSMASQGPVWRSATGR
jgi:LysR family glycine cleavage system transcriptional activator